MKRRREANLSVRWIVIALAMHVLLVAAWLTWWFAPEESAVAPAAFWTAAVLSGTALLLAGWGGVQLRRAPPGIQRTLAGLMVAVLLALAGLDGLLFATTGWMFSTSNLGMVIGGALGLGLLFIALLALARLALRQGGGMVGVARTVLDEAIHMKVAVVFIVLLLLVLPALPFLADASDPLRYRVQGFLSYSMMVTMLLLSLLTIFLACWTLSGEIEQKQIFTIATKPISRTQFLLGKWVGIVTLNGILLAVASVGIWGYTTQYLAKQEPTEAYDGIALEQEVLTARIASRAQPAEDLDGLVQQRLERIFRDDPDTIRRAGEEEAERRGMANPGADLVMDLGATVMRQQLWEQVERQWRSVPPMGATSFVFDGLERAHEYSEFVQFRYFARVTEEIPDGQLRVIVDINGRQVPLTIVTGQAQVVPLPVDWIQDGRVEMTFYNRSPANPDARREITLVFDGAEGLEVLYRVGSFGPNFARAMLANWVKLAFLAMLGLLAATFLGFPVASLFAILIFSAAAASPFLLESSQYYGGDIVRGAMAGLNATVATLLQSFAHYSPRELIVRGRFFGWTDVIGCALWIGVLWTGGIGLLAAFIFSRRELGRVQV